MYEKNILKTLSNKSIIVSVVQAVIQGAAGLPTIFKKKKKERNTKEKEGKEKRKGVMFYVNRASCYSLSLGLALPCLAGYSIQSRV